MKALITYGGWEGHEPDKVAALFAEILRNEGMEVELSESLASFDDAAALAQLGLIVPVWTMGEISRAQSEAVAAAVAGGVGLAGCHGGMCDAFRNDVRIGVVQSPTKHNSCWRGFAHLLWRESSVLDCATEADAKAFVAAEFASLMARLA